MHRFFHTIVIVGVGATSGCAKDHTGEVSEPAVSEDASKLADRVIEDAEKMRDAATKRDAGPDAELDCDWEPGEQFPDSCPAIR